MEIPGLGVVTKDKYGSYVSQPLTVPVLGNKKCQIGIDDYDDDPRQSEFHTAIKNFLTISPSVLQDAAPYVFEYYEDMKRAVGDDEEDFPNINSAAHVFRHVRLGAHPQVRRRAYGDKGIYVSLECGCDWEPEHGLQIVFKNGLKVNKVGPFNGHLTVSDAYADKQLENVIYR